MHGMYIALLSTAQHCGILKSQKKRLDLRPFFIPSLHCVHGLPKDTMFLLHLTASSSATEGFSAKH